jgi:hypothetical protein
MAPTQKNSVKLWPAEIAALDRLKGELKAVYGAKASREDIVGAMAHGVTEHQLFGMLAEYQKHDEWGTSEGSADVG